jgi:hypothetical protein
MLPLEELQARLRLVGQRVDDPSLVVEQQVIALGEQRVDEVEQWGQGRSVGSRRPSRP